MDSTHDGLSAPFPELVGNLICAGRLAGLRRKADQIDILFIVDVLYVVFRDPHVDPSGVRPASVVIVRNGMNSFVYLMGLPFASS